MEWHLFWENIKMRNKIDKISSWIKGKVDAASCKGVVFGLSGGIDSAVVAALCRKSMAKDVVLGVIMPCESQEEDKEDAFLVASKLDLNTNVYHLNNAFQDIIGVEEHSNPTFKLASANLKARLRMATLYYIANQHSYLVVGTGNKTEIMVGYFSKYGDSGVDIEPIGDIYKTEVFKMAKELGLPEKIINKAPSAGLWKGQTDEGEMGITYKELDKILMAIDDKFNKEPFKTYCQKENITIETLNKVWSMIIKSEHKRKMPPIYPID